MLKIAFCERVTFSVGEKGRQVKCRPEWRVKQKWHDRKQSNESNGATESCLSGRALTLSPLPLQLGELAPRQAKRTPTSAA